MRSVSQEPRDGSVIQTPDRRLRVFVSSTLGELAETGRVIPIIDQTYPLEEAAEAIRYLEVEHARAKVVITVSS